MSINALLKIKFFLVLYYSAECICISVKSSRTINYFHIVSIESNKPSSEFSNGIRHILEVSKCSMISNNSELLTMQIVMDHHHKLHTSTLLFIYHVTISQSK